MLDQAYPTPSPLPEVLPTDPNPVFELAHWQRADGWIEAPYQPGTPDAPKRLLGVDCEMVRSLSPFSSPSRTQLT